MVAAVAADANLAVIAPGLQNPQAVVLGAPQSGNFRFREPQAEPLGGAGAAVLHAGVADVGLANAAGGYQPAGGFAGRQPGFFHFHQ